MGRIRIESKTKDNRDTELVDELVKVWESSVRTSHDFLSEQDIRNLAPQVKAALQGVESLVVVYNDNIPAGFMGIQERNAVSFPLLHRARIGSRTAEYGDPHV